MVPNAHVDNSAGHFARDLGDIRLDERVLGRGVPAALQPDDQRAEQDEHRHADQRPWPQALAHGAAFPLRPRAPREAGLRPATTAFPSRGGIHRGNQGFLDALQQRHQLPAFLRREAGEGVFDRRFGDAPDALVHPLGFRREIDALDAAVVALGPACHPAIGHQPVDHAAGGRLFHLHHLGKLRKRGARMPVQTGQHQPLRPGDPEPADAAIELRPQQAGDVGDHDTNVFVGIRHAAIVAAGKLVS